MKLTLDTSAKVKSFAKRAQESYQNNDMTFSEWEKEQTALENEMMEAQKSLPMGICIGKLCRFGVADGYAMYLITKIGKRITKLEHIPFGDGYRYGGIGRDGSILTECVNPYEINQPKRFANRF